MLFKRVMASLALAFGFLGVVACSLGIYAVWWLGFRIGQANEKAFTTIDKGLSSAQARIRGVQELAQKSKITTAEIAQNFRDWSTRQAKERLVSQLEIERRGEILAKHLETADLWLETSTESIRSVQQLMELGNLVGAPMDPSSLDDAIEKLTSLRSELQQTEGIVDGIRKFTATNEGESEEHRFSRVTKLLGRMLLTTDVVDARLEESATRLSELQMGVQRLQERTSRYILLTTVGCFFLLAWMAAGQAALCLCGWKNCRRSPV